MIWRRRSKGLQLGYLPEWPVDSQEGSAGVEDWDEATTWVGKVRGKYLWISLEI